MFFSAPSEAILTDETFIGRFCLVADDLPLFWISRTREVWENCVFFSFGFFKFYLTLPLNKRYKKNTFHVLKSISINLRV